ncbi:uncharacterized protein LOC127263577 [Andrographis paniculata]|uniref:uncharacterized protein LOC127263577 n=1 Tax=Andrographis paniculata TaxID=175694 RepID=UPI0021E97943|nr:uncharacterized protein LOC127263577 [Andrographis paniculata]
MAEFQSPVVGALTVNYLSYGLLTAVNRAWAAWLTLITAVVGFWKVRALQSKPEEEEEKELRRREDSRTAEEAAPAVVNSENLRRLSSPAPYADGSPKVKFSLYFGEEELGEMDECVNEDKCGGAKEAAPSPAVAEDLAARWCDDWERWTVEMRKGDLGWYTCQDLRMLDGSVVRLWGTPRRRRYAGAVELWPENVVVW